MNRLMMIGGAMPRYMNEAETEGGGSNSAGAEGGAVGAEGETAPHGGEPEKGSDKPFLGDGDGDAKEKPDQNSGEANTPADGEGKPSSEGEETNPSVPEVTEQSFVDGIKADTKQFGENAKLDEGMIKALAPTLKESGITVEQANKLANEIAKYQVEQAKEAYRSRVEYFTKMKDESMRKYTPADFKTINAGINACFKKDGVMNHVIRNSELGADPEFLALMLEVGKRSVTDTGDGGATGGGSAAADPNSIDGLAKMW